MQVPALTTHATRNNSFSLLVALDDQQNAKGDLFWDDGESTNITQYVMKVLLIVYSLYVIFIFQIYFCEFQGMLTWIFNRKSFSNFSKCRRLLSKLYSAIVVSHSASETASIVVRALESI